MDTDHQLVTRSADIRPRSLHADLRTVEVVFATGARVLRGLFEKYSEELSLDPRHVRMDRLASGSAPVLANHNGGDLAAVVGVVQQARVVDGRGVATLRFAKDDPAADSVWRKIEQGILRNVSVGYRVHKYERKPAGSDEIPVLRATDWEPFEVSVVPMGADAAAVFRSVPVTTSAMPEPIIPVPEEKPTTMDTAETPDTAAAERDRVTSILNLVRHARLDSALAETWIASGAGLDQVRAQALDKLIKMGNVGGPPEGPSGMDYGRGVTDDLRSAAADGLLLRAGIPMKKPHAAARDFRSTSITELARTCLSRAGVSHSTMSTERLVTRAMTTSDFPLILGDAIHKSVRSGYENEPASHRQWVRSTTVTDFKDQFRPILGSAPSLEKVLEHGEYKEGSMTEDSTSYRVEKYGRIVAVTYELLVNDDLGAFLRIQPALGQAARRLEADVVYALLALNGGLGPTMQDAVVLFHSSHGNLGTAGTFDAALLGAGRTLLRKQTAVGGGYLSLVPRYLLVPSELETSAEVLLASASRQIVGSASDTTPSWVGGLQLVVEPRLPTGAAYLIASSGQVDTVEFATLEENGDGPQIFEDQMFTIDILRWKIRHVFGAKVLDWRGIVKLPIS